MRVQEWEKQIAALFAKEGAKVIASDMNEVGVKELIASAGDIAGEIVFYSRRMYQTEIRWKL